MKKLLNDCLELFLHFLVPISLYQKILRSRYQCNLTIPKKSEFYRQSFLTVRSRNQVEERIRYVVVNITKNLLFLPALSRTSKGNSLVHPRVNCTPGMDAFLVLGFRRCQFPVRVCFSMTINKALRQLVLGKLGLDLSSSCFAHGYLCVALSRATHPGNIYVSIANGKCRTKSVVYPKVLSTFVNVVRKYTAPYINLATAPSKLKLEDQIAKRPTSEQLREPKVIELDDGFDLGSYYDTPEKHY